MFALIDSRHNADGTMFYPKADEEEYYNEYDEAFNDEIVGSIVVETEPYYKDDRYKWIDHKDIIYDGIYKLWCGVAGPMPNEKLELEAMFFTASDFPGNNCGYNLNPGRVHPAVTREMKRRPTSTAPSNRSTESLEVTVKRVSDLLDNDQAHTAMVLKNLSKMNIKCNNDLYVAVNNIRDSPERAASFVKRFKDASQGFNLPYKEVSFLRCASMYMDGIWE